MANKLVLDTNIWIYLTKENFEPLLESLKERISNEEIELFTNEVILKEWNRNKDKTIKTLLDSITQEYKSTKNLAKFLVEDEKIKIIQLLESLDSEEKRLKNAEKRVNEVEELLLSSTKIEITDEQKLFIANLAIEKIGPFANNKNNFNDALIVRNIVEYCKEMTYPYKYDLIYVSNNPQDFCIDGKEQIYPEILNGFEHLRLKNVTQLGQAFELSEELIDDFDDWLENELQNWAENQYDISRGK